MAPDTAHQDTQATQRLGPGPVAPPLAAAFDWLDLAIRTEILRLRARYTLSQDEFHGLYISDAQVDALIARREGPERFAQLDAARARAWPDALRALAGHPCWRRLVGGFGLQDAEAMALFIVAAPLARPRYGTLYAYLNDDVRARWPTLPLVLSLIGGGPGAAGGEDRLRHALSPGGRLLAAGLLEPVPAEPLPCHPGLRLPALTGGFLAGAPVGTLFARPGLGLVAPDDRAHLDHPVPSRLAPLLEAARAALRARPVAIIGPEDSGRRLLARRALLPLRGAGLRGPAGYAVVGGGRVGGAGRGRACRTAGGCDARRLGPAGGGRR